MASTADSTAAKQPLNQALTQSDASLSQSLASAAKALGDHPNQQQRSDGPKAPPKGIGWIMLTNMVISVNYSMLMVTGFKYVETLGQSKIFYGAVIAAFPLGRLILLMPMGLWSDKGQFKYPFAICNFLSVIGGLMYGFASALNSPGCALAGRVVGGIGACQPVSAWAARGYPPKERTRVESMQKSMNLMGVIVGPALNAFVANLDVKMGPADAPIVILNAETAAGYFPAILSFILLVGTLLFVEEPPLIEETTSDEPEDSTAKVLCSTGAWVCLLLAFQTNLQLAAIDTVLADLNEKVLGWDIVANSIAFAVIAVLCLFGAVLSVFLLNKGLKCTTVIAIGLIFNFFVSVPGMWAVASYDVDDPEATKPRMPLFLFMGAMQCIAIMFYTGPTGGIYQQAIGKKQGVLGGLYLMFFAGGRPCGAMLGSTLLQGNTTAMVILTPVPIVLCLLLHLSVYRRLNETDAKALAANEEDDDLSLIRSLSRTLSTRGSFSGAEQVGR